MSEAFLLKIDMDNLNGGTAIVPKMKSAKLSQSDVGTTVFIWVNDQKGEKSRLYGMATLLGFDQIEIPQVRNPDRSKSAYRLRLSDISSDVRTPLATDDLEPYRYSSGTSALETLGRLHRDRNDKLIELSIAEHDELRCRFC